MMAQVMVPNQAAAFAMITPDSMGRASTFFNTMRQVGSATGVAVLSTVLISAGTAHGHGGTSSPDITGYRFAFLAAAIFALARGRLLAHHPRQRRGGDHRPARPAARRRSGATQIPVPEGSPA